MAMAATQGTSLAARLKQLAEQDPGALAVTCAGAVLTRGELDRAADILARDLRTRGVSVGDYVSIVLPNGVDHPIATLAAWKLGAVPAPLSPKLARRELAEIISLTKPAIVIGTTDATIVGTIPSLPAGYVPPHVPEDAPPLPDAISPSWKALTSGGSTGRPKVIRAGQPGVFELVARWSALTRLRPGSNILVTAPLSQNAAFMVMSCALVMGGHAIFMARFEAEEFLRLVEAYRVAWVLAVPTMMTRISKLPENVRARYDLSSIETLFHGASPCPPETKDSWIERLGADRILEAYSATEAQAVTLIDGVQWLSHRGSVGRVVAGEIQIRDEWGQPVSAGTVGRVWVRQPSGTPPTYEYIGAEAHSDKDGWETVGDMGRFDAEGYLYLADRDTDMILVGGSNVYPAEVEAAILEHPAVLEACVIGLPDDELGSVPHAVVQLAVPVEVEELAGFVADRLAPYKRPHSYEVVAEPMWDEAGKVRRSRLIASRR